MTAIAKIQPAQHDESANVLAMISRAASDPSCDLDKME